MLDHHRMPDRDRIPQESIHYLLLICKTFVLQFIELPAFLFIFYVYFSH